MYNRKTFIHFYAVFCRLELRKQLPSIIVIKDRCRDMHTSDYCETPSVFSDTANYDENKHECASSIENKSNDAWCDTMQLIYSDFLRVNVTERAIAAFTTFVDAYCSPPVDNINDTHFASQYPNGMRNELEPSLRELFKTSLFKVIKPSSFSLYDFVPHKLSLACSQIYLLISCL